MKEKSSAPMLGSNSRRTAASPTTLAATAAAKSVWAALLTVAG
jgi:hypothetical protein